jgi:hypothetical protein
MLHGTIPLAEADCAQVSAASRAAANEPLLILMFARELFSFCMHNSSHEEFFMPGTTRLLFMVLGANAYAVPPRYGDQH